MNPNDFTNLMYGCYAVLILAGTVLVLLKKNEKVSDLVFYDALSVVLFLLIVVTIFSVLYFKTL